MATVSTRISIRWGDGEPSEPTSTLVLSSPERRYVDVRLLLPEKDELYWGFAGTSEKDGDTATFHHPIDSRSEEPGSDTGTFTPHPDDPTLTVEKGKMVDFDDGEEKEYEEIWRDEEPAVHRCVVLELKGRSPNSKLADQPHDAKGMVVRLGNQTQGILKYKGQVTAERWGMGEEEEEEREAKAGCGNLPCAALSAVLAQAEEEVKVGYTLDDGQFCWEVVEESTW